MKLNIKKAGKVVSAKSAPVKKAVAPAKKAERKTGLTPAQIRSLGVSEPFAVRAVDGYTEGAPLKHEVIARGKYGFILLPKGCKVHAPENKIVTFRPNCTVEYLDGQKCKSMFCKEKDAAGDPLVYGIRETADGYQPVEKNTGSRGVRWQRKTWGQMTKLEEAAIDRLLR